MSGYYRRGLDALVCPRQSCIMSQVRTPLILREVFREISKLVSPLSMGPGDHVNGGLVKLRLKPGYRLPGITGPPNSFTARGPVTLTSILFTQPAAFKNGGQCVRALRCHQGRYRR